MREDLQRISDFLAHRNCELEELRELDCIVIAGNSFPSIAEFAASAYHQGISKRVLICGGVGHSTKLLYENMERLGYGKAEDYQEWSEAEVLAQVLVRQGVAPEDILMECTSTNTGANASHAKELLKSKHIQIRTMLLLQDPLLQLRTYGTFAKVFPDVNIYSYAPFTVQIDEEGHPYHKDLPDLWTPQRFLSLLIGELKRVRDDEQGYGPLGSNYMIHIDLPDEVKSAAERVEAAYQDVADR